MLLLTSGYMVPTTDDPHHHRHHTLLRYDGPILGPSLVRVRNYESEPQSNVPFKKGLVKNSALTHTKHEN